jgi:hypothetical protein
MTNIVLSRRQARHRACLNIAQISPHHRRSDLSGSDPVKPPVKKAGLDQGIEYAVPMPRAKLE